MAYGFDEIKMVRLITVPFSVIYSDLDPLFRHCQKTRKIKKAVTATANILLLFRNK